LTASSDLQSSIHKGNNSDQGDYRWVMLALLWLLYASFGLLSRSIFPLVSPILRDLHISYSQMGVILGSWQLTYIVVALLAGGLLDRWGKHTILAGVMIMGLSCVLRYFPHGFWAMLGAVALFGAGGPVISIGGPKMISQYFKGRSRGTAIGIYMTGPWIGGMLALALTNSFVMPLTGDSWRLTFVSFGALAFAVGFLWYLFAKEFKHSGTTGDVGTLELFGSLMRVRNIQVLLIMGLFAFAIGHGFSGWLPKILESDGMSATRAGLYASMCLAAAIPSILLVPRLVPPYLRGRSIALLALITGVSLFLAVNGSGALRITGLILFGVADSAFVPIMLLILMDSPEVEPGYMGAAGGMFFCVSEIGGVAGPLAVGALVDMTGTFMTGGSFLAGLCIAIIAMTFFLKPVRIS